MKPTQSLFSLCGTLLAICGALVQGGLVNPRLPTPSRITRDNSTLAKRGLVDLRIMPLGASIVWGLTSLDGNGFRLPLRDQLRWEGYNVNMVGTKYNDSSTMSDNDSEATPGYIIDEIHTASKLSYGFKPNVVLINAGTNDCARNTDVPNAHVRLESMINDLWTNIGDTTVIAVSTVIISSDASLNTNRAIVNSQYRSLVSSLQAKGKPIYLTELDNWMTISDIGPDGIHPNMNGYRKMAGAFWKTIAQADKDGAIRAPQDVEISLVHTGCSKIAGGGVSAGAQTQTGSGYDDGIYYHDSAAMATILNITSPWDRNQWSFARLFTQARDDLLGWISEADGSITFAVWRNDGGGVMTKIDDMTKFPNPCIPRGLRFIDLNGDGLDDFVCISNPDGALIGVINNGDGGGTKGPTWTSVGLIKAANPDFPQAQVRLADIDGDGRADYIGLGADGTAHVWRNGGTGNTFKDWQSLGVRWTGGNGGDLAGVRFEDLNGDGRDDWMWVADVGTTTTWTNSRSCAKGLEGNGLNVAWRQGYHSGASSGPTHLASFNGDVNRNRIHFARIYGEPESFSLLGRQDYVYMEHVKDGDLHTFKLNVWKSKGSGATKLKADGNKYGNMQGSPTGRMDYVWSYSNGRMVIFRNAGIDYITSSQSYWTQPQQDLFNPQALIGRDLDRRDLSLTDFDGDGKADIVWVDPDNNNRVSVFINKYDGKTWSWEYQSNPAPVLSCTQKRGLGIHDLPVRWGDISGNGRDDYVCIEPNGRMSGYVHETDGSWTYNAQFFGSKGYDRANFQFGDVNGDGKDDIIWTEKFSGDGYVYYNDGPLAIAGSSYHWDVGTTNLPAYSYYGNAAGTCIYYPDLNGDGRVDQQAVLQTFNNIANTAYNLCVGDHTGDDEAPYTDPGLPIPTATPTTGTTPSTTTVSLETTSATGTVCRVGTGDGDFLTLCAAACAYSYCPKPCTCLYWGAPIPTPGPLGVVGWPAKGYDCSYLGLCSWLCDAGNCRHDICTADATNSDCASSIGLISAKVVGQEPVWLVADCENAGITDASIDQEIRWNAVGTPGAWSAALADWKAHPYKGGLTFVEQVSNFFHGPENMNCGQTADHNGCYTDTQCQDVNHPAGYFILNSLAAVSAMNLNFYDGLGRSEAVMSTTMSGFAATFAKIKSQSSALRVIEDIVGLSFALAVAPLWNKAFKQLSYFKTHPNLLATMKDTVNPIVSNGITITKDSFSGSSAANAAQLETMMGYLISLYYGSISDLNKQLFNGSDYNINLLWSMIDHGKLMEPGTEQINDLEIQGYFQRATYSYLIPKAWALGDSGAHPFILDSGADCSDITVMSDYLSDSTAKETSCCVDNKLYYLVSATAGVMTCTTNCQIKVNCQGQFKTPPGLTSLVDGAWGGVTLEDLVRGALNGYAQNGNKNGWGAMNPTTEDDINLIFDEGVQAPGVVQIPVCSAKAAWGEWKDGISTDENYPCPSTSSKSKVKRAVAAVTDKARLWWRRGSFALTGRC